MARDCGQFLGRNVLMVAAPPWQVLLEAHLTVRHRGCYTEGIHGDARAVQLTAGPGSSLLVVSAGSTKALDAIVERFAAVNGRPYEVVERSAASCVLRIQVRTGGVVRAILDAGANVLWPAIFRDGHEHYTILVRDKRMLAAVAARVGELGEVRVARSAEVATAAVSATLPFPDLIADLTQKQLAVLLLAVKRGYYRAPRGADTADIARELGVTRSTLSEHLRKAEARILARIAAAIEDQPAVQEVAQRKPGRPPRSRVTTRRR